MPEQKKDEFKMIWRRHFAFYKEEKVDGEVDNDQEKYRKKFLKTIAEK